MAARIATRVINGQAAADGAGVKLHRVFGPNQRLDPFLMLDEFNSDDAADYIAGFPSHPHRGFETVTYMLEGEMLHEDHLGNRGRLTSGSVQWMSAGRGVIHSEMPQQDEGRMRGFQLWINLPAAEKMKPAAYRDIAPEEIPERELAGARVKLVAGKLALGGEEFEGAVYGVTTDPLYVDLKLEAQERVEFPVRAEHTVLVYVYDGTLHAGGRPVRAGQLGVLEHGDTVQLHAEDAGAGALILAAKPLGEPVVHYGPFVMNSVEEIEQALRDYRDGRLVG